MNEKIRALAKQAGQGKPFHIPPQFVAKFAELIVKECCDIIQGYDSPHRYVDGIIDDIKNQFGIYIEEEE